MRADRLYMYMRAIGKRACCSDCAKGGCSLRGIGKDAVGGFLGVLAKADVKSPCVTQPVL